MPPSERVDLAISGGCRVCEVFSHVIAACIGLYRILADVVGLVRRGSRVFRNFTFGA